MTSIIVFSDNWTKLAAWACDHLSDGPDELKDEARRGGRERGRERERERESDVREHAQRHFHFLLYTVHTEMITEIFWKWEGWANLRGTSEFPKKVRGRNPQEHWSIINFPTVKSKTSVSFCTQLQVQGKYAIAWTLEAPNRDYFGQFKTRGGWRLHDIRMQIYTKLCT